MRKELTYVSTVTLVLLTTLSACAVEPAAVASPGNVTIIVPIDAEMFSERAPLRFTLWNADQLEILDRTANCAISYDAELQKEEIICPEGVEYEEVTPEEVVLTLQQIGDAVTLESDHLNVGERYRLQITGLSLDNCNTTSASVDGVAQQAEVILEDLQWATTLMACP